MPKQPPIPHVIEQDGDLHPDLQAAQAAVLAELAYAIAQLVSIRLNSGKLIVVDGCVTLPGADDPDHQSSHPAYPLSQLTLLAVDPPDPDHDPAPATHAPPLPTPPAAERSNGARNRRPDPTPPSQLTLFRPPPPPPQQPVDEGAYK